MLTLSKSNDFIIGTHTTFTHCFRRWRRTVFIWISQPQSANKLRVRCTVHGAQNRAERRSSFGQGREAHHLTWASRTPDRTLVLRCSGYLDLEPRLLWSVASKSAREKGIFRVHTHTYRSMLHCWCVGCDRPPRLLWWFCVNCGRLFIIIIIIAIFERHDQCQQDSGCRAGQLARREIR